MGTGAEASFDPPRGFLETEETLESGETRRVRVEVGATDLDGRDLPDSDTRRFDALSDPVDAEDLARVAAESVREDVRRIRELVDQAEEARPPLVLGVGAQGLDRLRGIGYTGDDDGE